ncbi:putative ribonuclease H-like domain-containing protein [Tanacetum coccineum]
MLYRGVGRRSEAKNEFEIDIESGSYWLDKVRTSIWRDVRTLAIEEAYTTKYSIHPGADTMLCGFRLTNRWLSMKKDIASCGSKYLAYSEVEVEYQGSSGLLLQPELWVVEGLTLERCSMFGKKDKLEMSYVGPFEIFGYIGPTIVREVFVKLLLDSFGKLSIRKKVIGTKWVFRNKRDERSIVVKNKASLVAQGFRQEEGIDYDEEVYVQQPSSFVDHAHPNKVYKVIKALYGLHQALRAWYETLSTFLIENGFRRGTIDKTLFIKKNKSDIMLVQVYVDDIIFGSTKQSMCTEFEDCMHKRFQMSSMGERTFFLGLQVQQQPDGIFISQDKYVADILKKFDFCSIRTATTTIESKKSLVQDKDGVDVDVHVYRSMIGSLMYLTALRPDIMFVVYACARFQVTLKASHLNAIKRIFSDYGGASLDRKSTTGGCQFLSRRLISWQCKKQTIVANSTTGAKYVTAANCYGKVLWIQNQMMDYDFNFMNTKIHIDNESTICIVKNPVYHSRTKHIEIQHHFIRDCYEKRLIDVVKIHTDNNVADLLTKGFDVTRFNFLVISIGMLNL